MNARDARMNAVPELALELLGIEPEPFAAAPTLNLRIGLRRPDGGPVQCVLLTTTVTIAAARRGYEDAERDRITRLIGPAALSDDPPGGLLWARIGVTVPTFRGATEVTVALPCGHDMQVTADQYLRALAGGEVPLDLAFDGTVFYPGEDGVLRTAQIPCRHRATGELPVRVWRSLVDRYYGAVRWLRLDEDRFDRLAAYRARRAHTSFDDTVDELLRAAESLHGDAGRDDTGRMDEHAELESLDDAAARDAALSAEMAMRPEESGPWTP
ncbi:DUF6084 family protein [Actinomadura verrucosospora]|uniref:Uncharacterized protein n=1 Tax=Actinomadura verrucosospora TaxID=46165 RepID=A0A7D3VYU8_ACTVE|nr:DUF6084 family protein [Actinomadura verrucosospora]QKG22291.1 hypothetical protein ACTIVE_3929 [Actinomadura verrucosospora]